MPYYKRVFAERCLKDGFKATMFRFLYGSLPSTYVEYDFGRLPCTNKPQPYAKTRPTCIFCGQLYGVKTLRAARVSKKSDKTV